jgi:hypothetical protein
LSVIEEYCATRITGTIGFDNNKLYEETFIGCAEKLHADILNAKLEYRFHRNVDKVLNEVYDLISTMLKFAAYFLGDCEAKGIDYANSEALNRKEISWLHSYIERLNEACLGVFDNYGKWNSVSEMELVSDVLDSMAKDCGIIIRKVEKGFWVDVL